LLTLVLLLAMLCLQAQSIGQPSPDKSRMISAWKLEQSNGDYGPVTVYVSDDGLRYDIQRLKASIICAAPSWQVCVCSKPRKLEYVRSFEEFRKKGLGRLIGSPGEKSMPTAILSKSERMLFGQKCIAIRYRTSGNRGMLPSFYGLYYGKNAKQVPAELPEVAECEFTVEKFPVHTTVFLTVLANMPVVDGLPLTSYSGPLTNTYRLRTKSINKPMVSSDLFMYPIDYTKAVDCNSVLTTANAKEDLEDAFGTLFDYQKKPH